jgi:hypothetical protein
MAGAALEDVVVAWLRRVTAVEAPPRSVIAFNIGLLETEDGFSAYLAGAKRFDPDDDDWACDEDFAPEERYVPLPVRRREAGWERVREMVVEAVRGYLASKDAAGSFMAKAKAVTVGFDDGDLVRVR